STSLPTSLRIASFGSKTATCARYGGISVSDRCAGTLGAHQRPDVRIHLDCVRSRIRMECVLDRRNALSPRRTVLVHRVNVRDPACSLDLATLPTRADVEMHQLRLRPSRHARSLSRMWNGDE